MQWRWVSIAPDTALRKVLARWLRLKVRVRVFPGRAGIPSFPPPERQQRGELTVQKLYTTETLAELLQVSPRTIRRERKEGRLPFVRVRGQIRYRESDVRSYLERNASMTLDGGSLASHANWGER